MGWIVLGMLAVGASCLIIGILTMSGRGSADERSGGALPILAGCALIVVAFFVFLITVGIRVL